MGNMCPSCCVSCMGYNRVNGDDGDDDERTALFHGRNEKSGMANKYDWEQHVLDDTVMKSGKVAKAAIISFSDGSLRAAAPAKFNPSRKGIKDILDGLKGDVSGLADNGISLGSGVKVMTPGKLDKGKAIYASDGASGGCTIVKSQECVLIVVYTSETAAATRLATEVAEYMADQGH